MSKAHIPEKVILCKYGDDIKLFEKENPFKIENENISNFMRGKVFNPPFFKLVILNDTVDIEDKQVKCLYNNVLMNGTLIIPKKYFKFFENMNNPHKKYEDYILIHKKVNKIMKFYGGVCDVVICGTQKASTTSALLNMRKHPDISAYKDELHYIDLNWWKGESFFKKHHDYNKKIVLAKNPDLMYLENTHWMIQNMNPYMKLIIILRNPINRAYSSWQMVKNNKWTNLTFEEAIEDEIKYRMGENRIFSTAVQHFLQRGLYYKQIKNLLKWFPVQNIKIMVMEKFSDDMKNEYKELYNFIGLPNISHENTKERINVYDKKIDKKVYNDLKNFFIEDTQKLEELLGYKTGWF